MDVTALLRALPGQTVGVMGMGVSGVAMAQLLQSLGATLHLVDSQPEVQKKHAALFKEATWATGDVASDTFAHCHGVAVSPGVPPMLPCLQAYRATGRPLFGEVELLAVQTRPARTLAISGTNGKSTTTALCGALMQGLGYPAFVGGNLGNPISDWLRLGDPHPYAVLELSSYQIDGRIHFAPDVAVMLNVTPDHLARYGTLAAYTASKGALIAALPAHGVAVLNAEDPAVYAMASGCRGRIIWFTTARALPPELAGQAGWVVRNDVAVPVGDDGTGAAPMPLSHPILLGAHNQQNTLAALAAVHALVAKNQDPHPTTWDSRLQDAYRTFAGLPHRLALAGLRAGVRYLNDSKATNDASAAIAVRAMTGPFILLVGGQDKGGGYAHLVAALRLHPAKAIVAFGEAQEILHHALAPTGIPLHRASTLVEACGRAESLGAPQDTVLLSPACTSFDAFANYQHRGDVFTAWVRG
jgi:UDP-N-acetylmuramoylalanine--D-glutamate ligase